MISIDVLEFGSLDNGETVKKFILKTEFMQVSLTNYGASLIGLCCPDKNDKFDDILLGFDTLQGYIDNKYFGSTIGRFANRIQKGQFVLDGIPYQLACNNGDNHLHGGDIGFDEKVWSWTKINNGVQFDLISEDGDEGYPGKLHVSVTYTLMNNKELSIVMKAYTQDKPTIVNLTNHAFINLAGQSKECDVLDHALEINSTKYLPHKDGIPSGNITIADAPFDFHSKPKTIGQDLGKVDGGYDHNYCLDEDDRFCARIEHKETGRVLEIYTNQVGLQFYSGNFLNTTGKNGNNYLKHSGFCLEPQNYPDNVNQALFPSSVVRRGDLYEKFITWKLFTN